MFLIVGLWVDSSPYNIYIYIYIYIILLVLVSIINLFKMDLNMDLGNDWCCNTNCHPTNDHAWIFENFLIEAIWLEDWMLRSKMVWFSWFLLDDEKPFILFIFFLLLIKLITSKQEAELQRIIRAHSQRQNSAGVTN